MAIAMVTGASSGIGLAFCDQLATRGHDLVMVARSADILEQEAKRIRNYYGVRVEVLPADLGNSEQINKVGQRLADHKQPIALLVNNAGFAPAQEFTTGDLQREISGLEVMVKAVMLLSYQAIKQMRLRGNRGAIINVSSVVSGLPMGTYAAHKSWVEQFTASLVTEVKGSGIDILCLKPGTTRTRFFDQLRFSLPKLSWGVVLDPHRVAEQALDDLSRGKTESIPGVVYRLMEVVKYKAPRPIVKLISGRIHRNRMKF